MQRLENWETNWFFNHCTFFSCFSKPEKNWNLCYWRRFDMMTSKSVRRNVTRSWGLSLEKIEFFSTDFLALVGFFLCLSGTSLHSPSSMVTNYYVQLKNHLSSPFLVKKLLNFWKKKPRNFEFWRHFVFVFICQFNPIQKLTFTKTRPVLYTNSLKSPNFCWFSNSLWKSETQDQYVDCRWMPRADGRFHARSFQIITDLVT